MEAGGGGELVREERGYSSLTLDIRGRGDRRRRTFIYIFFLLFHFATSLFIPAGLLSPSRRSPGVLAGRVV